MTSQHPGPGGRDQDPVEEFFAAHRAQVRDEPADDLTWQRVRETRHGGRPGRRGAWTGALVAAVAALAVVMGPSLLPEAEEPDLAGTPSSTTDPAGTGEPAPTDEPDGPSSEAPEPTEEIPDPLVVTTPAPEGGVPDDGRFTDVTSAAPDLSTDTQVRHAVVMHPCASQGWCSVLASSEDAGTTWRAHADLEELGMVHHVLFVDHARGWVWGDKAPVWTTTDGGRTWTQVDTGDLQVVDLAVQADQLLATVWDAGDCGTAPCHPSSGSVVVTDPTSLAWADEVAAELGPVETTTITGASSTHYVLAQGESGRVTSILRFQEELLESTAALSSCGPGPVAVTASAGETEHLWAFCDDERGLALQESDTGGRTWTPSNLTVPPFVLGEQPPLLASTGAGHLLLVGEGNYAVTTDGGQTWSPEAFLPGTDARPERVEIVSGEVIAYPTQEQATGDLAYWRSGDGGLTWETVALPR